MSFTSQTGNLRVYRARMDFMCLGKDTSVDVLLSGTNDEDILALMDQVIETSPSFSEFSSSESGVVSPDPFMEEDLFTTFFRRDHDCTHGGLSLVEGELAQPVVTELQTTPITLPAFTSKPVPLLCQPKRDIAPSKMSTTTKIAIDEPIDRNKKNALAARQNRQKKKEYVHGLENRVGQLSSENDVLKRNQEKMEGEVLRLRNEVEYLKSVLVNQSALANILENLPGITEVGLSSSIAGKRSRSFDADQRRAKNARLEGHSGGVCIHVGKGSKASLEFCSHCSLMSTAS